MQSVSRSGIVAGVDEDVQKGSDPIGLVPAVRLTNLTCHYGVAPVIRDLTLEVPRGDLLVIMGPNGSGKSTLLGAMAGIVPPRRGTVHIFGKQRRSTPEVELACRRQCCYLPAESFLPNMTAAEWVVTHGRIWGVEDRRLLDHAARLLDLFELGTGSIGCLAASSGQRKKIALCSALVTDAPILLLDEPFAGGLDPSGIRALKRVLEALAENRDRTIVMATPVPELVENLARRVAILQGTRIAALATPGELCAQTGQSTLEAAYEQIAHPSDIDRAARYLAAEKGEG